MKLDKMSSNHHLFRWAVLVAGFAVNACLGVLYAWSIFVPTLESEFGLTRTEVSLPFVIATLSLSFSMIFTGQWQDRSGPRVVALSGAVFAGGSYMLSSLAGGLPHLLVTYGLIAGLGNAAGYVAAVSSGLKWFPDKRGLASGIVVGGCGIGALIFAPVAMYLMDTVGWRVTFATFGAFFLVVMGICALILRNPPRGWMPIGWKSTSSSASASRVEHSRQKMMRTSRFYILWMIYFISCLAGLMVISHLKPFATKFAGLTAMEAAFAVSILSAFNFIGRILPGWVSDVIGRIKTLAIISAVTTVNMLLFPIYTTIALVYVGAAIVGLCFGANLGLFPAITADNWGTEHLGLNYGIMFTAWGVGGLAGPVIGGYVYDVTGRYTYAFWIGSLLAAVTLVLMYLVTRKRFEYREYVRRHP